MDVLARVGGISGAILSQSGTLSVGNGLLTLYITLLFSSLPQLLANVRTLAVNDLDHISVREFGALGVHKL